jgi:hypothetical protein
MSNLDMEKALQKFTKKIGKHGAPQSARTILEENKQLIQEKLERKAFEKKQSKDFNENIVAKGQVVSEMEQARGITRITAKRELAHYYKSKIAEKEAAKATEYSRKVEEGSDIQYFPYNEGENITKSREAQNSKMREEMRSFLSKQREEKPPRMDPLLADVDTNYSIMYPVEPTTGRVPHASTQHGSQELDHDEVAPHMQRYPRFLTRAREHMSRRLHDAHVRKALEDKVRVTRVELEKRVAEKQEEQQREADGILVSDTVRLDANSRTAQDRKTNAEFLAAQMHERRNKNQQEVTDRRSELPGYWGPEEKPVQNQNANREVCVDLIKQMEVDQNRRLDSRGRRLRQERRLNDNCVAEMMQDRDRERHKNQQHREVLVKTWASQQKIKEAARRLDC